MIHGFLRAAAASPECTVADSGANTAEIVKLIQEAADKRTSPYSKVVYDKP